MKHSRQSFFRSLKLQRAIDLALIGGATAILFFFSGYQGNGGDLIQYILPAYAEVLPGFATNDWFVHQTPHYHYLFSEFTSRLLKFDVLEVGLFTWYTVAKFICALGVYLLVKIFNGDWKAYLLAIALIVVGPERGWGNNSILPNQPTPHTMAFGLAPLIWYFSLSKKPWPLCFALIAVNYTHANAGLTITFATLVIVLFHWKLHDWNRSSILAVAVLVLALVPLELSIFRNFSSLENANIYKAWIYGRAPHHFAPHLLPAKLHLNTLAGCCLFYFASGSFVQKNTIRAWLLAICALFLGTLFFLKVVYWPSLTLVFPYRLFPQILIFASVLTACAFFSRRPPREKHILASVIAAYVTLDFSPALSVIVITICVLASWKSPDTLLERWIALPILVGAVIYKSIPKGTNTTEWPRPHFRSAANAITDICPSSAIVTTPPIFVGATLLTHRAVIVDFKTTPFNAEALTEWNNRMHDITGLTPSEAENWAKGESPELLKTYDIAFKEKSFDAIRSTMSKYNSNCLILHRNQKAVRQAAEKNIKPNWQNKFFNLYAFNTNNRIDGAP